MVNSGTGILEAGASQVKAEPALTDMRYWMKGLDKVRYLCSVTGGSHTPKAVKARGFVTVKCSGCGWTMVMHHSVYEQLLGEQK